MRPSDWSPLRDSDPLPGDCPTITELANHLSDIAQVIRDECARMQSIDASEIWDSDAATAFAELQEKLPPDLEMAATRYENAAGALTTWEGALSAAQAKGDGALTKAKEAQADIEEADLGIQAMEDFATQAQTDADTANAADPEGPPMEPAEWTGPDHHANRADAERRLEEARTTLEEAEGERDTAGSEAAGALEDASDDDLENPGWFEEFLLAAADILSIAGAVLGVLSIFFPVLAPLALAVSLVSLALNFGLAAAGKKGWKDFFIDLLGVATLGLGKGAGLLGRLATARPMSAAASRASAAGSRAYGTGQRAAAGAQRLGGRSMAGVRVPNPNGGRALTGAAARSNMQARYAAVQRSAQARAQGHYQTAAGIRRDMRNIVNPPDVPWSGWGNAHRYAGQNFRNAYRPAFRDGPWGVTGVTAELGVSTGISGYQTYDASGNIANEHRWAWARPGS